MPRLSCWSCGRQIYTVAPLESLFAEERRCPRCGAFLREDRREVERRLVHRRVNPAHDPGPPRPRPKPKPKIRPKPTPKIQPKGQAEEDQKLAGERRIVVRRTIRRRGGGASPAAGSDPGG
jgi:uncharacterized C2H2 Zn-finger protein